MGQAPARRGEVVTQAANPGKQRAGRHHVRGSSSRWDWLSCRNMYRAGNFPSQRGFKVGDVRDQQVLFLRQMVSRLVVELRDRPLHGGQMSLRITVVTYDLLRQHRQTRQLPLHVRAMRGDNMPNQWPRLYLHIGVCGTGGRFFRVLGERSGAYRVSASNERQRNRENRAQPFGLRRNPVHTSLSS